MEHLPDLIKDLGLILIVATVTTLLFKKMKQPVVLGYILAGLIVGPKFPLFPNISDIGNIKIWAEIGVIILLFSLGLEFSFKKLMKVGGAAGVTGIIEVPAMLGVGFVLGRMLGWPLMDCLFLGGILSIASTTIIIRAFDELGVKGKKYASLVFGVLVIEDIVAIILMVLLSTIAVSQKFAGMDMLLSIAKLVFFLLLWFIAGIFFIPSILNKLQKHLNNETLLVLSLGLCLAMVILASGAGFSPALGAFIMGSILAETLQGARIEHLIVPIKDLFGAVFFVSVGMLIDPQVLVDYALPILIITVVFVVFKTLHVMIGAILSGQTLHTSLHAGMSMAQIGEFSFIIATLGVTLNVTSNFLYPIAVAVSALTTFSTPYMIKAADPLYHKLEKILPAGWQKALVRYSTGAQTINKASDWQQVIRSFLLLCVSFSIIVTGIIILFKNYVQVALSQHIFSEPAVAIITAATCTLTISPFLWGLTMRNIQPASVATLWANKRYQGPLIIVRVLRVGVAMVLFGALLLSFFQVYIAVLLMAIIITISFFNYKRIHHYYLKLEQRFFYNFNQKDMVEQRSSGKELAPWDAHMVEFTLPQGSALMGKSLEEIAAREHCGVNIAMIKRGDKFAISAPGKNDRVYPGDRLYVIGTDEQIERFNDYIQPDVDNTTGSDNIQEMVLKRIDIGPGHPYIGVSIRESGLRERTRGLIVGIERGGRRMLNPSSNDKIEAGDQIWIVGDAQQLKTLLKEQGH